MDIEIVLRFYMKSIPHAYLSHSLLPACVYCVHGIPRGENCQCTFGKSDFS